MITFVVAPAKIVDLVGAHGLAPQSMSRDTSSALEALHRPEPAYSAS
ncbi:hypothetical protein ThimaDRAFT_2119 [Thiocapsa marina 5811]|uniref:Uncharacterized protein n=1 Tax=Thiocapsa marina 5811 TaxID=768671 RepID=F9UB83_9GAMM|nr:hypothetical protein ThimaDRAFT_2119 [Thiocapsa marina 5811]